MTWSSRFDDPIPLPDGRQLVTLKDAADYLTKLPKAEHDAPEAAVEALILVAENGGPTMFARIGVMRGLTDTFRGRLIQTARIITGGSES